MQLAHCTFRPLSASFQPTSVFCLIALRVGNSRQPRRTGERPLALLPVCNHSRSDGCSEADQQGEDHRTSSRAVSQIATASAEKQVFQIPQGLKGSADEVG